MKISDGNTLTGTVMGVDTVDGKATVLLDVNGVILTASVPTGTVDDLGLDIGKTAQATIDPADIKIGAS